MPVHRRTTSTSTTSSSSSSSSSSEEKSPLLKAAQTKVRSSYGSLLYRKQEQRKSELKKSISKPISQEPEWWNEVQVEAQKEDEQSMASVYSTQTWEDEEAAEAFEYEEEESNRVGDRDSVMSFTSSERCYTFF